MTDISQWNATDASNTSAAPAGAPEGWAPSDVNNTIRAMMGAAARWFSDQDGSLNSTGSANAYVVAANNTVTALADCPLLVFKANFANTGAATLQVDSLTAKAIKKNHDLALGSGDIEVGQIVVVAYNATDDVFELVSSVASSEWQIVQSQAVGTGASLSFETGFDAGFDHEFTLQRVYPDSADNLVFQVKEAGAYISGSTDYRYQSSSAGNTSHSATAGQIGHIKVSVNAVGADVAQGMNGHIRLIDPGSATYQTAALCNQGHGAIGMPTGVYLEQVWGEREAAAACQGIKFLWNGGDNFAGGIITQHRRRSL